MEGVFISFEGAEGSGKSTQIRALAGRLITLGREVITLREPGGTPLGEEIRHLLKHSSAGRGMCPEAELLLINASRAQLVREIIRPALARGAIVLCDRFHDSTIAYQVFGRGLPARQAEEIIHFAAEGLQPHLTFLLRLPLDASRARQESRAEAAGESPDRFEQSERSFFERVERGYEALSAMGGTRVRTIDATRSEEEVGAEIWRWAGQLLATPMAAGEREFKSIGEYRNRGPG